jgi:hypothetical protein
VNYAIRFSGPVTALTARRVRYGVGPDLICQPGPSPVIPSPATGYNVLASFILRILLVSYSELPQNLGKRFKLTYAKLLKCLVWLAMG